MLPVPGVVQRGRRFTQSPPIIAARATAGRDGGVSAAMTRGHAHRHSHPTVLHGGPNRGDITLTGRLSRSRDADARYGSLGDWDPRGFLRGVAFILERTTTPLRTWHLFYDLTLCNVINFRD